MNTTANVRNSVDAIYSDNLLYRANAANVHAMFAQQKPVIRNGGSVTTRFRRYQNLLPATTPLVQGQNPPGVILSSVDITVTPLDYGNYIPLAATVKYTTVNSEMTEMTMLLEDNAAETYDILTRNVLNANFSVFYAGNATLRSNIDATDLITVALLRDVTLYLKGNNAKKIMARGFATNAVGTVNVRDAYVAIVRPEITEELRELVGWRDRDNYPSSIQVLPHEVGSWGDFRFVESTNAMVYEGAGTAGANVYSTVILADHAYGTTYVTGETLRYIVKPVGSAGAADALDQFGTMGWKGTYGVVRLNESFMTRIESAAKYGQ